LGGGEGEFEVIMGIKHHSYELQGLQFHSGSVVWEFGLPLLMNFIRQNQSYTNFK